MRCPTLVDLPPPPPGKTGWPWTVETPQLPALRTGGSPWPRISIVTPSFNQGQFIEETIRSILLQGYPDVEYFVIDASSTDVSVDVIRKYAPWLTAWVSEPDRGQAHAITKGLARSSGEIFNWINSDDALLQHALRNVGETWRPSHTVIGPVMMGSSTTDSSIVYNVPISAAMLLSGQGAYAQHGIWMPRDGYCRTELNLDLHYAFDWDMALRYFREPRDFLITEYPLAYFRLHQDSKTVSQGSEFDREGVYIMRKLLDLDLSPSLRAICRRALRRHVWHRRAERIASNRELGAGARIRQLAWLIARRPNERLDRYALGRMKRLILANSRHT